MSRYGKIETGFWHSTKMRGASQDARYLMLYLLSCPHGNAVGCFVLHNGYIAADLGWQPERVTQTLSELFAKGLIEQDEETFLTRIVGWWGHNGIENQNVAKHVVKEITSLPNCKVKQNLIADTLKLSDLHETVRQTLSKGLGKPFRNHNTTQHNTAEPNPTQGASAPDAVDVAFEKFKAKYPRRGKADNAWKPAKDEFARLLRDGHEADKIILGAEVYAQNCADLKISNSEKVAKAQTWLEEMRFNDYFDGIEAEMARRKAIDDDMRQRGKEWRDGKWRDIPTTEAA